MKRNGTLNSEISKVLSCMGHTDCIAIADCGLPIPEETKRIDLALSLGHPSFMEVLKTVADDMKDRKDCFGRGDKGTQSLLLNRD